MPSSGPGVVKPEVFANIVIKVLPYPGVQHKFLNYALTIHKKPLSSQCLGLVIDSQGANRSGNVKLHSY